MRHAFYIPSEAGAGTANILYKCAYYVENFVSTVTVKIMPN